MDRACLAFPILPGRREFARALLSEIADERRADFASAGWRLALTRVHWFLVDAPGGDQVVVYLEGSDVSASLDALIRSRNPFDRWFKSRLAEAIGIDLNDPPEGMRPPELLASFAADSVEPPVPG